MKVHCPECGCTAQPFEGRLWCDDFECGYVWSVDEET